MKITTIDPVADERWDQFVSEHPEGTAYHHSCWARVIQESYGYEPRYYVLEESEQILGGAPFYHIRSWLTGKRLVCLPFSDRCFPLVRSAEGARLLMDTILHEAGELPVEVRGWQNGLAPGELGFIGNSCYFFHLAELDSDPERLWERLSRRARRGVREAEKRRVTVREAKGEDDLAEFYRLNIATRKKLGVVPQPFRFFKAVYHYVLAPGNGFLLLAEDEGKNVVAGVLYLLFRNTITYKFNASDPSCLHLRPNNLLIWKGMEWACQRGYRFFDFGRSAREGDGLRAYKSQWATREIPLPYYYYPAAGGISTLESKNLKYRVMSTLVRCMPSFALRLAGATLYRHVG